MSRRMDLDRLRKCLRTIHAEGEILSKGGTEPPRDTEDTAYESGVLFKRISSENLARMGEPGRADGNYENDVETGEAHHSEIEAQKCDFISDEGPSDPNLARNLADASSDSNSELKLDEDDERHDESGGFCVDFQSESQSSTKTMPIEIVKNLKLITVGGSEGNAGENGVGMHKLRRSRENLPEDVRNVLTELGFRESSSSESKPKNHQEFEENGANEYRTDRAG